MRLCYFFLKFFVCAILYAFSNYGFKRTNIQTTIQFEFFIFFLKSSFSPFEICRLAYIEALCLRKVFVTPNTFSESSSLILERKKLRLPGKSFSIFVSFLKKYTLAQKNLLLFSFYIFYFIPELLEEKFFHCYLFVCVQLLKTFLFLPPFLKYLMV